jgi:hypothetical protein
MFVPDYRTGPRQRYCAKAECRQARKRQSQQAWLAKPGNQDYFRDQRNAQRVRDWQKGHPDYWKNTTRYRRRTLQDGCLAQAAHPEQVEPASASRTLQDLCSMQTPLLLGLISMLVDSTLPDDIATSTRRLLAKGHSILGVVPGMTAQSSLHEKTRPPSRTTPESAASV